MNNLMKRGGYFCAKFKNHMKFTFILIGFVNLFSSLYSFSQTYATEELRLQSERHIAEKNMKLGISQNRIPSIEHVITGDSLKINQEEKLALFDMKKIEGYYKLVDVKAINSDSNYSEDELNRFSDEANSDYSMFHFAISNDLLTMCFISRNDLSKYKVNQLEIVDNELIVKDCKACEDSKYKIILLSNEQLTLELKPQDEWQKFTYHLNFKKY